ncbi:MAG: hypothetical protein JNK65_08190 [Deltaproteobacteria bacterium]|nr:hypothetical protein [Deltaproteobacteria bacterium]
MNLIPDITVFIQLALFILLLLALNSILFQPVLRVLEKRSRATVGVREELAHLSTRLGQRMKEYEDKIQKAKLEGIAIKEKLKKQADEQAFSLVSQSKEKAEKHLEEISTQIGKEQSEARLALRKTVEEMGREMAQQLLSKKI